jgi:hypothetical protein
MTRDDIDDEERRRAFLLRSLTRVGPEKPVGYLPLYTLREIAGVVPATVSAEAVSRGLVAAQFGPGESCIKSGALYLYDRQTLSALLQAHADILVAAGIPTEPDAFVATIAAVWLEPEHPAYPIIAMAFGETPS